jgi:hypothetical protein
MIMAKCKYKESCGYEFCLDDCCPEFEAAVETNADRIRAMSDEELADWLARTQIANVAEALAVAKIPYEPEDGLKDEVAKYCVEWLKQPAEE